MSVRFTLRQLEYFVAVAEHGGIALASRLLNVSSPSISTAISQLKDNSQVQLFVGRHARRLSLTDDGQHFYDHARRLLADAEGLQQAADDISGRIGGKLHAGCLSIFAGFVLPELCKGFEDAFPAVEIEQTHTDQAKLLELLARSDIDIALTYNLGVVGASLRASGVVAASCDVAGQAPAGNPLHGVLEGAEQRAHGAARPALEPRLLLVVARVGRTAPSNCRAHCRHGHLAQHGRERLWLRTREHPAKIRRRARRQAPSIRQALWRLPGHDHGAGHACCEAQTPDLARL